MGDNFLTPFYRKHDFLMAPDGDGFFFDLNFYGITAPYDILQREFTIKHSDIGFEGQFGYEWQRDRLDISLTGATLDFDSFDLHPALKHPVGMRIVEMPNGVLSARWTRSLGDGRLQDEMSQTAKRIYDDALIPHLKKYDELIIEYQELLKTYGAIFEALRTVSGYINSLYRNDHGQLVLRDDLKEDYIQRAREQLIKIANYRDDTNKPQQLRDAVRNINIDSPFELVGLRRAIYGMDFALKTMTPTVRHKLAEIEDLRFEKLMALFSPDPYSYRYSPITNIGYIDIESLLNNPQVKTPEQLANDIGIEGWSATKEPRQRTEIIKDVAKLLDVEVNEENPEATIPLINMRLRDFHASQMAESLRSKINKKHDFAILDFEHLFSSDTLKQRYVLDSLKFLGSKTASENTDTVSAYADAFFAAPNVFPSINPFSMKGYDHFRVGTLWNTDLLGGRFLLGGGLSFGTSMYIDDASADSHAYAFASTGLEYELNDYNKITPTISTRYLMAENGNDPILESSAGLKYEFMLPSLLIPHTITAEGMLSSTFFNQGGRGNEARGSLELAGWFKVAQDWIVTGSLATAGLLPWGDSKHYTETYHYPTDGLMRYETYLVHPFHRDGGISASANFSAQYRVVAGELGFIDLTGILGYNYFSDYNDFCIRDSNPGSRHNLFVGAGIQMQLGTPD